MRILVVSAHYPPNFVSGGTLVPQRMARGLRSRGHDVSVYAGWLEEARAPLATWDEVDETGLAVRWVVTTPWTAWSDRQNFDNPAVAADFAEHLAALRPDIVHVHALQSLGAGILEGAARHGAKVVLTMHDFWWVCARQFLVDRQGHPCPLVVETAECACEIDHEWLKERNAWLRERLAAVDLVLAPSTTAAAVLVANGVDPARLEVDENGLPDDRPAGPGAKTGSAGPAAEGTASEPLRVLYTGGSDRMKGVHILAAAGARLSDRPGWSLVAYGTERFSEESPGAFDGVAVDARPPFEPSRLNDVFADADVLVVPSVMRESHSLVTREALTRGVPVVCTDCIGPEEVVVDGMNGLVVAADDHRALAAAIERLVDEPQLLDHLRAGCEGVRVRSLDDQVAGVEAHYARLLQNGPTTDPTIGGPGGRGRAVRRVAFLVGIDGAPLRYRAWFPAEALELLGVASEILYYRDERAVAALGRADAVVVYRVPATPQVLEMIGQARAAGIPVFFDVDDLIFDPDLAPEIPALGLLPADEAALWMEGVRRYRTTMDACDAFIGSTAMLCHHATEITGLPSFRFENGVGIGLGRRSAEALGRPRSGGPTRIGYLSGTVTHDDDWAMIEPVVVSVLQRLPDVELWLVGHVTGGPDLERLGDRVRRVRFLPWADLPGLLRDLDVNLAPLAPGSRFNEAKSAIKWLEAALVSTPTLASPTEPFCDALDDGRTGILAATPEEWESALTGLIVDHDRRATIGRRARRAVLLRWSPHLQGRRYLDILTGDLPPRSPAPPWPPVANDEPLVNAAGLVAVSRDGHDRTLPGTTSPGVASVIDRTRSVSRRAASRYRTAGLGGLAASAVRVARRRCRP